MIRLLAALICLLGVQVFQANAADTQDQFNGDQTLYELSYAADFETDFVARLTNRCTGTAAPFIIAEFPNPSLQVKRKLLGFTLGFISRNPYTGTRNPSEGDPRRPSIAAYIAAKKVSDAAADANSLDYLCDAYLWDAFVDYANAQLELVQYAIEVLKRENRSEDLQDFISSVAPMFKRIQNLVNGDPSNSRNWSYSLDVTPRS